MLLGLGKTLTFGQKKIYPYATGGDYVYLYEDTATGKTYRVHQFLITGTSTLNVEVGGEMDMLIVAGGGGGGGSGSNRRGGGGGGAGGVIQLANETLSAGTYTITVGNGGSGGAKRFRGTSGENSSFDSLHVAVGGGGGGGSDTAEQVGSEGGSGGGSYGTVTTSGVGTTGQGNNGGRGPSSGTRTRYGGGGGGAGEGGSYQTATSVSVSETPLGKGGDGIESSISGTAAYYGGGGGASNSQDTSYAGPGGLGGGGDGGKAPTSSSYVPSQVDGKAGTANTGGGGGGGAGDEVYYAANNVAAGKGGNGGSGIVIIRYVIAEKTLWTPAELGSSVAAWYDADDSSTITLNGSNVSQWDDKSGNGRHATQATAAKQPAYTTNGLNGKNVVTFDGSYDGDILTTTYNLTDAHTIVLVSKAGTQTSSTNSAIRPVFGSTTTGGGLLRNIGTFRQGLSSPLINALDILIDDTRVTAVENSWFPNEVIIVSDTYDGSTLSGWKNGSTYSTPLSVVRSGFGKVQIGGVDDILARRFAGTLAEVVVLDTSASTEDRQKLEGYLAHKWGLTNKLPSGHPYKYEPPYKVDPEEIVTDGLVLNLDAGDYASYPRSGTTWYNISGSGNNGTLTNGPTYDSANKGSIVFDGSDDIFIGPPSNSIIGDSQTTITNILIFKTTNTTQRMYASSLKRTSAASTLLSIDINSDNTGTFSSGRVGFLTSNGAGHSWITYNGGVNDGNWHFVACVVDTNGRRLYLDGSLVASDSVTLTTASGNTGTYTVGGFDTSNILFDGSIALSLIYTRSLSTEEIQQNFNALRGRYGI